MNWYEVKVKSLRYDETTGKVKKVSEVLLVDAVSVTDSEAVVVAEFENTNQEINITGSNVSKIQEVFNYKDSEFWFKCKVQYVDIDQKSGKEKKFTMQVLVNADNSELAVQRVNDSLSTMIVPFTVPSVQLTKIIEVIPLKQEQTEE